MLVLVLGLVLFIGVHAVRIVADGWRTRAIARIGEGPWKVAYSLVSALGLGLIVWGFALARTSPVQLWSSPLAMRHLALVLTMLAFVLVAAAYVPGNGLKARLHHPMVLGIKVWALAHLLANGNIAHVVLFGSFLAWAALSFSAARRRDRRDGTTYAAAGTGARTLLTVVVGLAAWAVFAFWLHGWWLGIRPVG